MGMRNKNYKKIIILSLTIALLAGGVYFVLLENDKDTAEKNDTENTSQELVLRPPTEEEKQAGDQIKQEIVDQEETQSNPPDTAEIIIVDASQYIDQVEVRSFVSNVIEAGNCTVTFSKQNEENIVVEVVAIADASSTLCERAVVPFSSFPAEGEWSVTVRYESENYSGEARTVVAVQERI